jgi:hypothetical protein
MIGICQHFAKKIFLARSLAEGSNPGLAAWIKSCAFLGAILPYPKKPNRNLFRQGRGLRKNAFAQNMTK